MEFDPNSLNLADIVEWAESPAGFMVKPQRRGVRQAIPIVLADHQRRILRHVFTADLNGKFPYDTVVYSAPKKSGKTAIGALIAEWYAITQEPPNLVLCVANDLEQAQGRVFQALRYSMRHNPYLQDTRVTENKIVFPNETEVMAIASDYASAAGSSHGLTVTDELWAVTTEAGQRLYEELTPIPTLLNSVRVITTYAGWQGQSELLWNLYLRGVGEDENPDGQGEHIPGLEDLPCWRNGRLFIYWDRNQRMGWQTTAYLESQKASLRSSAYLRLHENRWTTSSETFIDPAWWDACVDKLHKPLLVDNTKIVFGAVDASTKHDSTAVVLVYFDLLTKKIVLADHRIWQPTPEEPIDLEATVEAYLLSASKRFVLGRVVYDPTQMHRSATTLKNKGLPMEELPQSPLNLTAGAQGLYDLLKGQALTLYPDEQMRRQMLNAVAVVTPRGWKLAKAKATTKIDSIAALAMASHAAIEYGNYEPGVVNVQTPFTELTRPLISPEEAALLAMVQKDLDPAQLPWELR